MQEASGRDDTQNDDTLMIEDRRVWRRVLIGLGATIFVVGCAATPAPSAALPGSSSSALPSLAAVPTSSVGNGPMVTGFGPALWTRCGPPGLGASAEMPGSCVANEIGGSFLEFRQLAEYQHHAGTPGLVTVGRPSDFVLLKLESTSGRKLDLEHVRDEMVQNAASGTLGRDAASDVGSMPGREFVIEHGQRGEALVVRLFASDGALWVLLVATWQGSTDAPDVRRFLNSFTLTT